MAAAGREGDTSKFLGETDFLTTLTLFVGWSDEWEAVGTQQAGSTHGRPSPGMPSDYGGNQNGRGENQLFETFLCARQQLLNEGAGQGCGEESLRGSQVSCWSESLCRP